MSLLKSYAVASMIATLAGLTMMSCSEQAQQVTLNESATAAPAESLNATQEGQEADDETMLDALSVKFICSSSLSQRLGSNVAHSEVIQILMRDLMSNKVLCRQDLGIRESVMDLKKLPLEPCSEMPDGFYTIEVVDPAAKNGRGSDNLLNEPVVVSVNAGELVLGESQTSQNQISIVFEESALENPLCDEVVQINQDQLNIPGLTEAFIDEN